MRVIFFGTATFAVPSLEALIAAHHQALLCVTQPDRPRGRGLIREPSPVKRAAEQLGLPVAQPARLRASLFDTMQPEAGVVAAYGQWIPRDLLRWPTHGMLGVHPSLLPHYRGAAPVAWALLNGESTTGVTIFRLNERLDAGEIVSRQALAIEPREDAEALTRRLAHLGARELVRALEQIASGRARFEPQDEAQATLAPKLTKAQGRIVWTQPAEAIARLVRATVPWPGATTMWGAHSLRIWTASVGPSRASPQGVPPGTVVQVTPETIEVAAGEGSVLLHEVQRAGKRRMGVKEFLAGHPVKVGDRFGDA